MKGKIFDWKDDKGFGFILSEDQSEKIFFHISDVKTKERRPKQGDLVIFDVIRDNKQRLKAKNVAIEGLSSNKNSRLNYSNVEPVRKTTLDYLSGIILFFSISMGAFIFYQTKNLNNFIPFGVAAIIAITLLFRQKKPKESHFTCVRCKVVAKFDKRTVQAWSKGMDKIYCSACHQQWLSSHLEQTTHLKQAAQSGGSKSGCLGVFVVLALLPPLTLISAYHWFS